MTSKITGRVAAEAITDVVAELAGIAVSTEVKDAVSRTAQDRLQRDDAGTYHVELGGHLIPLEHLLLSEAARSSATGPHPSYGNEPNPFAKGAGWNLTRQMHLLRTNPELARQLEAAAAQN